MRPVLMDDVIAVARLVLTVAPEDRIRLAGRVLIEAHVADSFRKRRGRAHPEFGNGSLTSATKMRLTEIPTETAGNLDWLLALRLAADVVIAWKMQQAARSGEPSGPSQSS